MSVNLTKAIEAAAADSCRNIFKGRCGTHGCPVLKGWGFCQIGLNMAGAAVLAAAPIIEWAAREQIRERLLTDDATTERIAQVIYENIFPSPVQWRIEFRATRDAYRATARAVLDVLGGAL